LTLCQKDSYLRTVDATVKTCVPGTKKKTFNVELDETVLFAEGGGQPADVGKIGDAQVSHVFRDQEGRVQHVVDRPLEVGTTQRVEIDWDRRYDHMTHHTAQHVVSALAEDLFGWMTKSWALGSKDVSVEFNTADGSGLKVEAGQIEALEKAVNHEVRLARKVSVQVVPRAEALGIERLRASAKSMPEGIEECRLVDIQDLDLNLCCGTHVNTLAEIQMIKFYAVENQRGGSRVFFKACDRLLSSIASSLTLEKQLTLSLSCGPELFPSKVDKMAVELKSTQKETAGLREELSTLLGKQLAADAKGPVAHLHHSEGTPKFSDQRFLFGIADTCRADLPDVWVLITNSPGPDQPGSFLLAGDPDATTKLGPAVAKLLGGKGGGRAGKFNGRFTSLAALPEALALLEPPTA